jgi:hypothetical protein
MRRIRLVIAAAVVLIGSPVRAELPPQPPCAGEPVPTWSSADGGPTVAVWHTSSLPEHWEPAACSGLAQPADAVFVAVAGQFHYSGDALSILARVGAVSQQRDILYWSIPHTDWRRLLLDASALSGPDPALRRPDFAPGELRAGAKLFTLYDDDDRTGPVIFGTEIREAGPDGFVTVARNVTDLRLMWVSVAGPGDLSSMTSVHRVGPDTFDYYSLSAIALVRLAAAMMPDASHINRAVATYRYLAGIPGDHDPPAALK